MKKSLLILAIIIIIILAALSVFLYIKMAQYKKVIDYYFPMPKTITNVGGEITDIQDDTITIKTFIQDPYILPEKWEIKSVKVVVTNETEFIKHLTNTYKEVEFSELKVGDQINAQANEDIKNKSEFTAKFIEIFTTPEEAD